MKPGCDADLEASLLLRVRQGIMTAEEAEQHHAKVAASEGAGSAKTAANKNARCAVRCSPWTCNWQLCSSIVHSEQ